MSETQAIFSKLVADSHKQSQCAHRRVALSSIRLSIWPCCRCHDCFPRWPQLSESIPPGSRRAQALRHQPTLVLMLVWWASPCNYSTSDSTAPSRSFGCELSDGIKEYAICNSLSSAVVDRVADNAQRRQRYLGSLDVHVTRGYP